MRLVAANLIAAILFLGVAVAMWQLSQEPRLIHKPKRTCRLAEGLGPQVYGCTDGTIWHAQPGGWAYMGSLNGKKSKPKGVPQG